MAEIEYFAMDKHDTPAGRRILFVCTGNICRSPMAEGMLRTALARAGEGSGWTIASAGVHAARGQPPAPMAVTIAARYGADIGAQRSRPFEDGDFQCFDDIIAMDRGHLDYLEFRRPSAFAGTLALLPSADGRRCVDVPDPYGGSRRDFECAARLIDAGVAVLLERWRARPAAVAAGA